MEIEFYSSLAEQEPLLHWILARGAVLIPDVHYPEPHYTSISEPAALGDWRQVIKYFVVHSDWQQEPLQLRPCINRHSGPGFYISARDGGPSIELALYRALDGSSNPNALAGGMVGSFPSYYQAQGSEPIRPNTAFRSFLKSLANEVKKGGQSVSTGRVRWWFTKGGWAAALENPDRLPAGLQRAVFSKQSGGPASVQ